MSSDDAGFPVERWLGKGLDLTTVEAWSMQSAITNIKSSSVIDLDQDNTTTRQVGKKKWTVPQNILLNDEPSLGITYTEFHDGTDAGGWFSRNPNLRPHLIPSASMTQRLFKESTFYAVLDATEAFTLVSITNPGGYLNDRRLSNHLYDLPTFATDEGTVCQYKQLFEGFGSHVVTGLSYGQNFTLICSAKHNGASLRNYPEYFEALYKGAATGGEYNHGLSGVHNYQEFVKIHKEDIFCVGGDPAQRDALSKQLKDYDQLAKWRSSGDSHPGVFALDTVPIWLLMRDSNSRELRERANDIENAYNYLIK